MRKRSAGAIYERTQRGGAFHTEKGEAVTEQRDEADVLKRWNACELHAYHCGLADGKALGIEKGLLMAARSLRRRASSNFDVPAALLLVWADEFSDHASALRRKRVGR